MKRTISFLLVLVLILGMVPFTAMAAEGESYIYINPLYADVITEEDLVYGPTRVNAQNTGDDGNYASTFEGAGAQLRKGMVAREETIAVCYQTKSYNSAYHKDIFEAAVAHTGNPKEGDALRWNYAGYRVRISRKVSDGVTYATFTYTMTYYTTAAQEKKLDKAVDAMLATVNPKGSDYEKLCQVYDWMCENIVYDYNNLYDDDYTLKYTAYAAMINKTSVCQGYALLLYRLALEMDIDCRVITGIGNGGGHGWNIIKLGNYYYNLDATWDAAWYQALGYYNYFLQCERTFTSNGTDHFRDAEYDTTEFHARYPISSKNYDPGEQPHEHDYTAKVTKPTCTKDGYTTYTCACGKSYQSDTVSATGHSWNTGVVTKEPTEQATGLKVYTCTKCGAQKEEVLDKLAHTHQYQAVVTKPTCTKDGYTTYTCACGKSYQSNTVSATGHSWDDGVVTRKPTEQATGLKVYTCTKCGAQKEEILDKLAHTHQYQAVVTKPTCTKDGYTTYTCECGDAYTADVAEALGHDYKNGTCTICGDVVLAAPAVKGSNKASTGKISLTWDAVEGALKYEIYRATSKTGKYFRMKEQTGTTYTNTTAKAGKYYYYYVRAIDADGNYADSNIVGRTCDLAQTTVKVSNVASSGKVKISWERVEGATKYQVYRATSKNGTYSRISTTSNTSVTNTKAEAGKTYYYKVRAICNVNAAAGAYSAVKSRTCDLPRPDVDIGRSSGKPKISWDGITGAVEYRIYRATSKDGTYSLVKTTTGSSWKDTTAKKNKICYYKVVAVCKTTAGNSAYSNVVSIKATK